MRKFFFSLFLPLFLLPIKAVASEQESVLTGEEQVQLLYSEQTIYYYQVLDNPRLYQDSLVYQDVNLTAFSRLQKADKAFKIKKLHINDQQLPVFELTEGGFIEASQLLLFDDKVEFEEDIKDSLIVKDKAKFWEQPYVLGTKATKTDQKLLEKVTVTKKAQTYSGLYYYVDKKGGVAESDTYPAEEAMALVQQVLVDKYSSSKFSVYVKDLTDQSVAQINANKVMYAASVTKLAPIYATQLQLAEGELSLTDKFKYSKEVNNFKGAYDTAGAGTISKVADNKEYSVEELLTAIGKRSDNAASNILTYYVTDKNSKDFQQMIRGLVGTNWDLVGREFSAKTAALMMEAIYEQGGEVINFLTDTEFSDSRIPKAIDVKVAHKTGDAYDYRHDVAIVYADRPFILSIFTDGAEHEDITAIAKEVYSILK